VALRSIGLYIGLLGLKEESRLRAYTGFKEF